MGVSPDVAVDVEKRWSLAKLIDGKLQIPLQSRTVSSDRNDPFIRQAMETAERLTIDNRQWTMGDERLTSISPSRKGRGE